MRHVGRTEKLYGMLEGQKNCATCWKDRKIGQHVGRTEKLCDMLEGQKIQSLLFSFLIIITFKVSNLVLSNNSIYIICTEFVLATISRLSFRVLKLFRNVELVLTILTWKNCCTQFSSRIN